jgi:hypothetical protein
MIPVRYIIAPATSSAQLSFWFPLHVHQTASLRTRKPPSDALFAPATIPADVSSTALLPLDDTTKQLRPWRRMRMSASC